MWGYSCIFPKAMKSNCQSSEGNMSSVQFKIFTETTLLPFVSPDCKNTWNEDSQASLYFAVSAVAYFPHMISIFKTTEPQKMTSRDQTETNGLRNRLKKPLSTDVWDR